ncbi:MAG: sigma-70 family RNA polymerase sigma factor [Saprospiraceae bacterium]|nr:sigma-70 family RNA polymerase sigma factor [Saprospiraceae bacterium]
MKKEQFPCDVTLLELIRSATPEPAFRLCLKKYEAEKRTHTSLRFLGASSTDAEDFCQEALMHFYLHLRSGKFTVLFEGCLINNLLAIAANLWRKEIRMRKRLTNRIEQIEKDGNACCDTPDLSHFETQQTNELEVATMTCLQNLSTTNRMLIEGFYLQNKTYQELADALYNSKNPNVAKQRSYIVRGTLKREVMRKMAV